MLPEVVVDRISSSTSQVGWIVFSWDMVPLDLFMLLDLMNSVRNELSILPLSLDPVERHS